MLVWQTRRDWDVFNRRVNIVQKDWSCLLQKEKESLMSNNWGPTYKLRGRNSEVETGQADVLTSLSTSHQAQSNEKALKEKKQTHLLHLTSVQVKSTTRYPRNMMNCVGFQWVTISHRHGQNCWCSSIQVRKSNSGQGNNLKPTKVVKSVKWLQITL